jgi:hypothetical protein
MNTRGKYAGGGKRKTIDRAWKQKINHIEWRQKSKVGAQKIGGGGVSAMNAAKGMPGGWDRAGRGVNP